MSNRQAGLVIVALVAGALGAGCAAKEPPVEEVVAGRALAHLRESSQSPGALWGMSEVRLFGQSDGPGRMLGNVFGTLEGTPWKQLGARWWPSAWNVDVRKSGEQPPTYLVDVRFWCEGRKNDGTIGSWERDAIVKVVQVEAGRFQEELVRFEGERELSSGAKVGHWFAVVGLGILLLLGSGILTRLVVAGGKGFWGGLVALAWGIGMALPFSLLLIGGVARGTYDAFGGSVFAAILGELAVGLGTIIIAVIAMAAKAQNS